MDDRNVVGFLRDLLGELKDQKRIKGDVDVLSSFITFFQVFSPLRGWTVKDKPPRKVMDAQIAFILRGLGLIER